MKNFAWFGRKLEHFCSYSRTKVSCFHQYYQGLLRSFYCFLVFQVSPFWIQLGYFLTVTLIGYLALKVSKLRSNATSPFRPKDFDVFFTSVSATTVSSMSSVEMEVFSNTQLLILTLLMLVGGEVFTSMLGLQLAKSKFHKKQGVEDHNSSNSTNFIDQIELGLVSCSQVQTEKPDNIHHLESNVVESSVNDSLKYNSIKYLGYVVFTYLIVFQAGGSTLVSCYINLVPSAREVLKTKGIGILIFSVFTTVSSFTNCGFLPMNENMIVFKKNSGLLLLIIPQILLGNTLYPSSLRFVIWVLEKITKRVELSYILKNYREIGYSHLFPGFHSSLLAATVVGFILIQLILFCSMEWNSEALSGLNSYQKFVGSLFQVVNSRHTGESILDLSIISPAILVLFIVMMYLPPYTSFLPKKDHERDPRKRKQSGRRTILETIAFSQLSYLVIFIVIICITERQKIKEDPLNFNVLNITFEVISAYGNVGFSTGYSCKRQLKHNISCKDTWYGFVGRWSNGGKFILILVMFFGRLKKFSMNGGKAWKLS